MSVRGSVAMRSWGCHTPVPLSPRPGSPPWYLVFYKTYYLAYNLAFLAYHDGYHLTYDGYLTHYGYHHLTYNGKIDI